MTTTQKILAFHSDLPEVYEGQLIEAKLDMVLGNDITSPVAINEFEKCGASKVFNKEKISLVMDHFTPNKDIKAAEQCRKVREFAYKHDIKNFFDIGQMGVEHALLPEKGLVGPGYCVIGADSHTCTYGALGAFSTGVGSTDMAAGMISGKAWFKVPKAIKVIVKNKFNSWVSGKDLILHLIGMIGVDGARYQSIEFEGSGIKNLCIDDRMTIANMVIECGAKNGIFPVDEITEEYCNGRFKEKHMKFSADADAKYTSTYTIDLSEIQPIVAMPHLPENTIEAQKLGHIKIDQVVIGSCTNGRLSDLRVAANILKNNKVKKGVRCIVIPCTQQIFLDAVKEGLAEIFINAGAVFSTPTCGPCLGGHMGILGKGEVALSTTNRNFVGRMGHIDSKIYLSSPAVAAASSITGFITDPNFL